MLELDSPYVDIRLRYSGVNLINITDINVSIVVFNESEFTIIYVVDGLLDYEIVKDMASVAFEKFYKDKIRAKVVF